VPALTTSRPRRPALWAALSFALGLVGAHYAQPPLYLVLFSCVLFFLSALLLATQRRLSTRLPNILLLSLVVCLGVARHQISTTLLPQNHILHADLFDQKCTVRGTIAEEPERGAAQTRFVLKLTEVETDSALYRVSGQLLVRAKEVPIPATYGDLIVLRGQMRQPQPARNPGGFDYRAFLARQHIHATFFIGKAEQIVAVEPQIGHWTYEYLILPIRQAVRRAIQQNLSGAAAGLLQGMLLGEKRRIPEDVRATFRSTGLAHALVISGLHVGLVALFFFTAFKLCRLSDALTAAATIGVLALYALVTELQPPVVRASVMASIVLLGRMLGRSGDIYNGLGLAAWLILAVWPTSLFTLSFQLSFGATLAIVGLHGPICRLFPAAWRREDRWVGKWIVAPLGVTLAAQLGTGPLIAYHFQHFAPISFVANLLVVPLLGLAVSLGLLSALSGWWCPLLATVFNAANYLVLQSLIYMVDCFADLPLASLATPRPDLVFLAFAAALCLLLAHLHISLFARKGALFLILAYLNFAVWSHVLHPRQLEVTFLDVGQGDGIFLRFPNGKTMVVDGGIRSPRFDNGARVVLPYLRYRNIDRIDVVVASHPHNDHIGGLIALLETVEVGHYIDSGQVCDTWTAGRIRELIAAKGIQYHRVAAGDSLTGLGGVGGLILHPTREFVSEAGESLHDLNNGSVVLRLTYGQTSLLLTVDIEKETDGALLAWGERLQAQILKVAHHGSRTSSQPRFVEAVDPQIALMQVGSFNRFGHPAPEVVQRYEARGTEVYRTDRRGAILLKSDGKSIEFDTMIGENTAIKF